MRIKVKIQRPARGPFTRDALQWDESNTAHIPARRFVDFILGEQLRLTGKTVFLIRKSWRKAPGGGPTSSMSEDSLYSEKKREDSVCNILDGVISDDLLYTKSYHCAYGPEDIDYSSEDEETVSNVRSKENVHFILKSGCQCRFEYRKLHRYPNVVCICFEEMRHVTREGYHCHGRLDPGFLDFHRFSPSISEEMQLWIYSRLQAHATVPQIMAEHRENLLSVMQQKGIKYCTTKDDFLRESNIWNVDSAVKKGTWKYLPKNLASRPRHRFSSPIIYDGYRRYPESVVDSTPNSLLETEDAMEAERTTPPEQAAQVSTVDKVPTPQEPAHVPHVTIEMTDFEPLVRMMGMRHTGRHFSMGPFQSADHLLYKNSHQL